MFTIEVSILWCAQISSTISQINTLFTASWSMYWTTEHCPDEWTEIDQIIVEWKALYGTCHWSLNSSSAAEKAEWKTEEVVPTDHCNNITEACLECIFLLCKGLELYAVSKGRPGWWRQVKEKGCSGSIVLEDVWIKLLINHVLRSATNYLMNDGLNCFNFIMSKNCEKSHFQFSETRLTCLNVLFWSINSPKAKTMTIQKHKNGSTGYLVTWFLPSELFKAIFLHDLVILV